MPKLIKLNSRKLEKDEIKSKKVVILESLTSI